MTEWWPTRCKHGNAPIVEVATMSTNGIYDDVVLQRTFRYNCPDPLGCTQEMHAQYEAWLAKRAQREDEQ